MWVIYYGYIWYLGNPVYLSVFDVWNLWVFENSRKVNITIKYNTNWDKTFSLFVVVVVDLKLLEY